MSEYYIYNTIQSMFNWSYQIFESQQEELKLFRGQQHKEKKIGNELVNTKLETLRLSEDRKVLKDTTNRFSS